MRVRISLCYYTGRVNISCACTAACICHLFITHHSHHGLRVGYSELINVLIAAATGELTVNMILNNIYNLKRTPPVVL